MAPPDAGIVQMLPCMSVAMVLPSGEIATDIDVPSRTVTSMVLGAAGAAGLGAGLCVPAGARRGAWAARAVNPATATTNNEISAARFMPRILQEVGDGCGSILARNYERESWHVDRALDRRNDHVELRSFLRARQDRPNRMKQGLALESGPIFHAIGGGAERFTVNQSRTIEQHFGEDRGDDSFFIVRYRRRAPPKHGLDRKSTRLNSSHSQISYAVFCLKKKK